MELVDLHVHTTFSDGTHTPREIIDLAQEHELSAIAIADHDTVQGIQQAIDYSKSVEVIPAVELSCNFNGRDIHILGYFVDYKNEKLNRFLIRAQNERLNRAKKMMERLKKDGVTLSIDRLLEISGGYSIGRPHIAKILLEKGYVQTPREAYLRFIGYHCQAYVPKMALDIQKAISIVKTYNGIPILAHPGTYGIGDELLAKMKENKISGIEVWHPAHTKSQIEHFLKFAVENNLLATGGSDFHGDSKCNISLGDIKVPYKYLTALKKNHRSLQVK